MVGDMAIMFGEEAEALLERMDVTAPELSRYIRNIRAKSADHFRAKGGSTETRQRDLQFQELRLGQQLRALDIPQIHRRAILTGKDEHDQPLKLSEAMQWLKKACSTTSRLIWLHGPCGTGKTLACCTWLADRRHGLFVDASYLLSLSPNFTPDRAEIERYERAQNLVVDDVGRGETDAHRARLEDFLIRRHASGTMTLCTTNKKPTQIANDYGNRIKSRLFETGSLVQCDEILRRGNEVKE